VCYKCHKWRKSLIFTTSSPCNYIEEKGDDDADYNGGGEGKVEGEVVLLVIDVAGEFAEKGYLRRDGEDNPDDKDYNADEYEGSAEHGQKKSPWFYGRL